MKIFIPKTFICFSLIFICLSTYAQTSLTINVNEPGSLETLIGETKYTLKELKLTGEIDTHDFDIIHQCASRGVLEKIDFSEVKLPDDGIPEDAFLKTESGQAWSLSLKTVILPKKLNRIGDYAFAGCCFMEEIKMPETLQYLGKQAFYECRHLKNMTIPENIEEIPMTAFYQCEELETMHLPSTLKSIQYAAFNACGKLNNVILPESLEKIESMAFALCVLLDSIKIPDKVHEIGEGAFFNCTELKKIKLPKNITEITPYAFMWTNLREIDIPEGVTKIGKNAFFWDYDLIKVTFPSTLIRIEETAFQACSFTTITLPAKLESIHAWAFSMCENLKSIYCMNGTPPELGFTNDTFYPNTVFENVDKNACTLYVPKGSGALYKNADGWKEFVNIIETDNFPSSCEVTLIPNCEVTSREGIIIVANLMNKPLSVRIYNMNGSLIHEKKVLGTHTMGVSPGIYLVKVGNNKTDKVFVK